MFGVHPQTVYHWLTGTPLALEFQQTLLRLECENLPKLSPQLSQRAIEVFNAGR
jgi:hypothetical protein